MPDAADIGVFPHQLDAEARLLLGVLHETHRSERDDTPIGEAREATAAARDIAALAGARPDEVPEREALVGVRVVVDEAIPIARELEDAVLALNNAHAMELSWLELEELRTLLTQAFYARRIGRLDAFLMAFDERAGYGRPNYLWFRARYRRFVYVDRVVVAPGARGRGLARALYADLFDCAARAGHDLVVCEVNIAPPNLASDALHAALGFSEVGQATIHDGSKTVRYLSRRIAERPRVFSS